MALLNHAKGKRNTVVETVNGVVVAEFPCTLIVVLVGLDPVASPEVAPRLDTSV